MNTLQSKSPTPWRIVVLFGLASLACVFVAGCGGPTLYSVEGDVVVDDKPLAKGRVVLWPDSGKGNTFTGQPSGEVENGKFKIMTEGRNGAPAGWYKVTVTSADIPDSSKATTTSSAIGPDYREAGKTPLKLEVVSNPEAGRYKLKASAK
jgi:hypothetical protein